MLIEAKLPKTFWREEVGTIVYIINREQLRVNNEKTRYELWNGKLTSFKHIKIFGSNFYLKMNGDNPGKFDSRTT